MQSLKLTAGEPSYIQKQLEQLNHFSDRVGQITPFDEKLKLAGLPQLVTTQLEIMQVNMGKMCNQTCKHCHVDAGPGRKEIMTKETMSQILNVVKTLSVKTLDLTGGAPEMNPQFRWFVEQLAPFVDKIIVRCNLTIILANKSYQDLPEFFKKNKVHVVSSLPFYTKDKTDRQRGEGVFEKSIRALKMLNAVGYGVAGSGLGLDLVYNPSGAFFSPDQKALELEFKQKMKAEYDIEFNQLFTITNMPISRFLDYLIQSENFEEYMEQLMAAFNPASVAGLMCKNTLSVGWDGFLYDCDFNQMLELKSNVSKPHIAELNLDELTGRAIVTNQHCYGCTAGQGSSCGGSLA